jgi:hypothetical protein
MKNPVVFTLLLLAGYPNPSDMSNKSNKSDLPDSISKFSSPLGAFVAKQLPKFMPWVSQIFVLESRIVTGKRGFGLHLRPASTRFSLTFGKKGVNLAVDAIAVSYPRGTWDYILKNVPDSFTSPGITAIAYRRTWFLTPKMGNVS